MMNNDPKKADLVERFLKSESAYHQSLQMIQHLFLEPVAPIGDPRVDEVFLHVAPIVDLHNLLWWRLEQFVDKTSETNKGGGAKPSNSLDVLESVFLVLYEHSSLFPVYISFVTSHDAAQQLLRSVLASSQKMAQLAKDASMLRPNTSLASLLQLIRARPAQLKRLCLHAAEALSKSGRHRRGCFAARHTARSLLQISEICRIELKESDRRFLHDLLNESTKPSSFRFVMDSPILWKGFVQFGIEQDFRLVVTMNGMLLLRKNTSFWSSATYELVGFWNSGTSVLNASFFSAKEIPVAASAMSVKEPPLLFGVRLSCKEIDWRIILPDRLASSVLMSAVKEMCGFDDSSSYRITLEMEEEDVWNSEVDGPPPVREISGSPEELKGVLRDLRLQYERDGAVVIESRALRALNSIGRDEFLSSVVNVVGQLCALVSDMNFAAACVTLVLCREEQIDLKSESAWKSDWKAKFAESLEDARADTLLRENNGIMSFSIQYMTAHAKLWLAALVGNIGVDWPFSDQCDALVRAVISNPLPSKVRWMLGEIRGLLMANEKLRPFLARGIGAVLLLRVIGPHFSVDRMRLCKFLAALVAKSFSTDEEIHQAVERNFEKMETFLLNEQESRDDAFAPENSFIESDEREADVAMLHVLDALMEKKEALALLPEQMQKVILTTE